MDFSKYDNKLPYPKFPVEKFGTGREGYESDKKKFEERRNEYYQEDERLNDMFKKDALEELGIANHHKAGLAYELAWEYGHSYGLTEVWGYLDDLADLLK